MSNQKPIRVFGGPTFGNEGIKFYATRHYKIDGNQVIITGEKFDVTNDVARIVVEHDVEFTPVTPPQPMTGRSSKEMGRE